MHGSFKEPNFLKTPCLYTKIKWCAGMENEKTFYKTERKKNAYFAAVICPL